MAQSYRHPNVSDTDINILLLGSTGDGMTTFINAFINYLAYDTLDIALKHELKVLIPTSFITFDESIDEDYHVVVGIPDENENLANDGHSSTKTCRSYVFRFSNRRIRFIDTPGIQCTQGVDQDMRNVENILNYVKHFTHLNTICFFSQAGVDRRTSSMQYVFEQLFGYLDVKTKNNIAFVFTNARSSFYTPCSKFKIMKALFSEWETAQCVKIPFAQNNCFLFDSEAFRFSAAKKNCIEYRSCDEEMYHTSWNHSTKELRRLIDFVLKCPVYSTSGWNTLYEARDLAYRTARPIAELVRLIQENISLAKYYKDDLLRNPREQKSNRMTEISGRFIEVDQPLEECSNSTCIKMKKENHDVITDPAEYCSQKNTAAIQYRQSVNLFVMSRYKQFFKNHDYCPQCGSTQRLIIPCDRCDKTRNDIEIPGDGSRRSNLNWIDQRILGLRQEELYMKHIYRKIRNFVKKKSFIPVQHSLEEYFPLILDEEKEKQKQNAVNDDVIRDLEQSIDECKKESDSVAGNDEDVDDIFYYVTQLYKLPIYGKLIQDHFETLLRRNKTTAEKHDRIIDMSSLRQTSKLFSDLSRLLAEN